IGRLKKMANPNDPKKGVDWIGSVVQGKQNGENAVQVLSRLADAMLGRVPNLNKPKRALF
ncbi:hypothetical protein KZ849_33565, partial [Pseudomonas aeruginosa]